MYFVTCGRISSGAPLIYDTRRPRKRVTAEYFLSLSNGIRESTLADSDLLSDGTKDKRALSAALPPITRPSGTLSVATSFIAVYLTFRRSPYFALAYAANDVALIVLWILAAKEDISYLSVIICFIMFLVNDLYGFVSWKRMERRQLQMA